MTKKSRKIFKYLGNKKNKKGFCDEIKSIFNHFWRTFVEANQTNFLEGEGPTLILGLSPLKNPMKLNCLE